MSLSKLGFVTLSATLCVGIALAEETAPKAGDKLPPNSEIVLDGKKVRTDDKGNVISDDAKADEKKPEESKEAKAEEKPADAKGSEAAAPAAPAVPTAEEIAAAQAAEAAAKAAAEKAAREAREKAQALVKQDAQIRTAVRRLATPGWRDAHAELVGFGKMAVPYLIEAMGTDDPSAPVAAYNLGGHTKSDTGRARRQRTVAEVCTETLTEIVQNHTNYKGEVPTVDQRAWQTWWAANAETVTFAK